MTLIDVQADLASRPGRTTRRAAGSSRTPNIALFLDVDGTLIDFAAAPGEMSSPRSLIGSLMRAERKLEGGLALVTGRAIEEVDRLFDPLRLRVSGGHGAQIRTDPLRPATLVAAAGALPSLLAASVKNAIKHFPGVLIEDKGLTLAVHYRLNPQSARWLRETLEDLIGMDGLWGVEIEEIRYAFELKPRKLDKGRAIALFLAQEPFRGRRPIFVGDDMADDAGFAEVIARGGQAYSLGRRRSRAMGVFDSPQNLRDWLAAFAPGERR